MTDSQWKRIVLTECVARTVKNEVLFRGWWNEIEDGGWRLLANVCSYVPSCVP
jgi:hypothetical protein